VSVSSSYPPPSVSAVRRCSRIPASVGRPQLSAIIRDLSLHCRAAKIAGCRLRGQEIAAATDADRLRLPPLFAGGSTMCQNAFDFYTDDDTHDVTS